MKYIASPTLGSGKLEANLMTIFVPRGWEMREGSLLPKLFWMQSQSPMDFQEGSQGFQEVRHQPLCVFPILLLQSPNLAMRKLPNWMRMITIKAPRLGRGYQGL